MKILISNDDGVTAPGILELNKALSEIAETLIVAPDRNRSGASSSLTLENPIRIRTITDNRFAISGTPADCIHIAREVFFTEHLPDLVVCGINMGANLGDDVIYSGTVAGAIEGVFLGVPAIAVSLVNGNEAYLANAAKIVKNLIQHDVMDSLGPNQILNVNVPDIPADEIKGYKLTRQGHRHRDNVVLPAKDARGNDIYWLGPPQAGKRVTDGTDFHAIEQGYVSITPLSVDLTAYSAFEGLDKHIEELAI